MPAAKDYKILSTYCFLSGLLILLINDHILKEQFANGLTGKLSDFAGLFIFPLFWTALFPIHKTKIFLTTGFLFIVWKSVYSQPFIDFWNQMGLFTIDRVSDYSDLIALIVLPFSYYFDKYKESAASIHITPVLPIIVCSFAFMATSYRTVKSLNMTYTLGFPKDTLINRLSRVDSLKYDYKPSPSNNNPDTLDITLPSTFCFNTFLVKMAIIENNNKTTDIKLISATHRCPARKSDNDKLIGEFEKNIIKKIILPGDLIKSRTD